jgi:hypothetical protein
LGAMAANPVPLVIMKMQASAIAIGIAELKMR